MPVADGEAAGEIDRHRSNGNPPALSNAPRIMSRRAFVILFGMPLVRPQIRRHHE
jgi:hypothetical protein